MFGLLSPVPKVAGKMPSGFSFPGDLGTFGASTSLRPQTLGKSLAHDHWQHYWASSTAILKIPLQAQVRQWTCARHWHWQLDWLNLQQQGLNLQQQGLNLQQQQQWLSIAGTAFGRPGGTKWTVGPGAMVALWISTLLRLPLLAACVEGCDDEYPGG